MTREENRQIFEDTERLCLENRILIDSISYSRKNQKVILENAVYPSVKNRFNEPCAVKVTRRRSFEAARFYTGSTAVHNFASWTNPGGGVVNGANAQEEALCRISTLYFCLTDRGAMKDFYFPHREKHDPLHNGDCIYTPDVKVFKSDSDNPRLQPEERWFNVDVITCAAPNLITGNGGKMWMRDRDLLDIHFARLCRIMDIAALNGVDNLILGAFGCGVFLNDPAVVAEATMEAVRKNRKAFRSVEFAVYCRPGDNTNYLVFADAKLTMIDETQE